MANMIAKIAFPRDSALPRDVMQINPTYEATDAPGLAATLKNHLSAAPWPGATNPFTIKIYSLDVPPPSYPIATAEQTGTPGVSTYPRELALCLSYYSGANRPRSRGRLYLPLTFVGGTIGIRPTQSQKDNAVLVADMLGRNLPSNVYWTVYSKLDKTGRRVTNVWADDEWDVLRSRGLRSTSRSTATIP